MPNTINIAILYLFANVYEVCNRSKKVIYSNLIYKNIFLKNCAVSIHIY